jgi:hypothetical protein
MTKDYVNAFLNNLLQSLILRIFTVHYINPYIF